MLIFFILSLDPSTVINIVFGCRRLVSSPPFLHHIPLLPPPPPLQTRMNCRVKYVRETGKRQTVSQSRLSAKTRCEWFYSVRLFSLYVRTMEADLLSLASKAPVVLYYISSYFIVSLLGVPFFVKIAHVYLFLAIPLTKVTV